MSACVECYFQRAVSSAPQWQLILLLGNKGTITLLFPCSPKSRKSEWGVAFAVRCQCSADRSGPSNNFRLRRRSRDEGAPARPVRPACSAFPYWGALQLPDGGGGAGNKGTHSGHEQARSEHCGVSDCAVQLPGRRLPGWPLQIGQVVRQRWALREDGCGGRCKPRACP